MNRIISFTNIAEDLAEFQLHFLKSNKKHYFIGKICSGIIHASIFIITIQFIIGLLGKETINQEITKYIIFLIGGLFLFYSSFQRYDKEVIKKYIKFYEKNNLGSFIGKKELTINEEWIELKNLDTFSSQKIGKTSCKIKEMERYIYIFISDITAFILPRKYLSEEDIIQLHKEIKIK